MSDKAWKRHERDIARALGSCRLLQKGRSVPDVASSRYTIECKYRQRFAVWSLFREIQTKYASERKPVVLVLKEARQTGALVVMDFKDWLNAVGVEEVPND